MPVKPSKTNTHLPEFNNGAASFFHRFGNLLVYPTHWGVNQLMKSTDPIVRNRAKAMGRFPMAIEWLVRPFRFVFGLTFAIIGIPLALIGQVIKVSVSAASKKKFAYYHYEKSGPTKPYSESEMEKKEVRVATWNLAAMHSMARRFNGTRPVEPRMEEAVEKILALAKEGKLPDVICCQEVFTETAVKILVEGLREHYPHIIHNVGKNNIGTNSGLMMFSRYPIDDIEFQPFKHRYYDNAMSQKGVLCATVTLPNNIKTVVTNVHLEAGSGFLKGFPILELFVKPKNPKKMNSTHVKALQLKQAHELQKKFEERAVQPASSTNSYAKLVSVLTGDLNTDLYDTQTNQFVGETVVGDDDIVNEMQTFKNAYNEPNYVNSPKSSIVEPRIFSADEIKESKDHGTFFIKEQDKGLKKKENWKDKNIPEYRNRDMHPPECSLVRRPLESSKSGGFVNPNDKVEKALVKGVAATELQRTDDTSDHLLQITTFKMS